MISIPVDIEYPSSLPLPYCDFQGVPRNTTLTQSVDPLALNTRRSRFTRAYATVQARWVFSEASIYDAFKEFFIEDLCVGANKFVIELRYPANSALADWIVSFQGGFNATQEDGIWTVEAQLDLFSKASTNDESNPV